MSIFKTLYEKDLYPELEEATETSFGRDCIALAAEQHANGAIDRRTFLRVASMLGAVPIVGSLPGSSKAAGTELVVVNWAENSIPAYTSAFGAPFEKANGIHVAMDGTGPLPAKICAMVQSGKVVWDLIDFDASKAIVLDAESLLQPIDYSIVDKNKRVPGMAYKAGVAFYIYSSVLTYDNAKFPDKKPNSWKDFWDVKGFPGQRALRKTPEGGVLGMHDGGWSIARQSLSDRYRFGCRQSQGAEVKPYNLEHGLAEPGRSAQWRSDHGSSLALPFCHALQGVQGAVSRWTWNEGLMNVDVWSVPKNNPAGTENAMRLIAFTQDPQRQIELLRILGNGPVNPAAASIVPDDIKKYDPSQPEHRKVQAILDPNWWNEPSPRSGMTNDALLREKWLDAISS